jgi:hypothetical protein
MSKTKIIVILFFVVAIGHAQTKQQGKLKYTSGKELINAMYNAYAPDKWYRHFIFSQDMEFYRNDSIIKREVWHEAYAPGKLIIKSGSKDSKTGRVYTDFAVYSFKPGQEPQKTARVHELLLVGLDVYFFKPELTVKILDSLGYDLAKIRVDEFKGRKVFVVGADKGDDKTKQFWIDAERLYMHRIIYPQKEKTNDVVFDDYVKMDSNWIAKTIVFKTDGKLGLIERYYDIKFPKSINQDWFNPEKFNEIALE